MAARLAGMSRPEFLEACASYHVSPYNVCPEHLGQELQADAEAALKRAA